jgi:hypothetical protein
MGSPRARVLTGFGSQDTQDWARIAAYAALPTMGLIGGPSYADIVFAIGALCLVHQLLFLHARPRLAPVFPALALGFVALCGVGAAWSVVPGTTLSGTVQMAAIFAGSMAFLAVPAAPALPVQRTGTLFTVVLVAAVAGGAVFWADKATGFHFQGALTHRAGPIAATKYNRGIDYFVLLAWPVLGWFCCRRAWGRATLLLLVVGAVAVGGASLAGKAAAILGLVVLGVALLRPRLVEMAMQVGIPLAALAWPFFLRAMAVNRAALLPYLKSSAEHRLEIWDYMTFHVMQRPVLGSGLLSSRFLDVPPVLLRHFVHVHGPGIYPHDQWLQLWVETGLLGLLLGAAFGVAVVRCARRLPEPARPFAYAAITAALMISWVNFEVTTDSWWGAIAACAFLFILLGRSIAGRAAQPAAASAGGGAGIDPK